MPKIIELPAVPPQSSILTGTRPLRDRWPDGNLHEGWARGEWPEFIQWVPECSLPVGTYPKCFRSADINGAPFVETPKPTCPQPESPVAIPFWINASSSCDTFGRLTNAEHKDRAERALNARLPYRVANAFWTGEVNGGQQFVKIDGVNVVGQSLANSAEILATLAGATPADGYKPVGFDLAFSNLLAASELCGTGEITFHLPARLLPYMTKDGQVTRDGDRWLLYGEYNIIFGPGYPGTPPEVTTGGPIPAPTAGTAWIYATGPVYRAVSEWTHFTGVATDGSAYGPDDLESAQQNIVEVRAEKLAVIATDPCCIFAALVQYA